MPTYLGHAPVIESLNLFDIGVYIEPVELLQAGAVNTLNGKSAGPWRFLYEVHGEFITDPQF